MITISRAGVALILFLMAARFLVIVVQFANFSDRPTLLFENAREDVRDKEGALLLAARNAAIAGSNASLGRYIAGMTLFIDLVIVMVLAFQIADPPGRPRREGDESRN